MYGLLTPGTHVFWVISSLYQSVSSSNSLVQAFPQLPRPLGIKAQVLVMPCRVLHIYCMHPPNHRVQVTLAPSMVLIWAPRSFLQTHELLFPCLQCHPQGSTRLPPSPPAILTILFETAPFLLPPNSYLFSVFSFPSYRLDAFTYLFIMSSH